MIRFRQQHDKVSPPRLRQHRPGMILAMVLVALLVVMLLGAALANAFLAQRQLARHNEQQQQALWLAESALNRAMHRFVSEDDYVGETWQVSPDDLGGKRAGAAVIYVEAVSEPKPGHRIVVTVSYPSDALKKTVQHRELLIARPNE